MSPLLADVARREVTVPLAHAALPGLLDLPEQPGLVVWHGTARSGYRSPRNAMVSGT
jgi:hypothetical protein